jgi:hypothetical protein
MIEKRNRRIQHRADWRTPSSGRRAWGGASSSRRRVDEGLQLWRVELGSLYAGAVRNELGAAIDRRLAELMILRMRRNWPVLKLVPASWILPIVAPGATRLRRSLSRDAVALAVSAGGLIVLIALCT